MAREARPLLATLLVISPRPNGVLIAKIVPTSGRAAGLAAVLGFFASFYLHGALAILGVSVLLTQSAQAFTLLKLAGAAYLTWIGLRALVAAWRGTPSAPPVTPARRRRALLSAEPPADRTRGLAAALGVHQHHACGDDG